MGSKKAKSVGISGGFAPTDLYCFRAFLYQPYPSIFYGSLNVAYLHISGDTLASAVTALEQLI